MFECVISGNPKPLIGWFHEVSVVEQSPEFMQFYDEDQLCSLVIKETYPEDTGRYTVVAKNKFGTATCAADLVVVGKQLNARQLLHAVRVSTPHSNYFHSFMFGNVCIEVVNLCSCYACERMP